MRLIQRIILKEVEENRKAKHLVDFEDLLYELNVSEEYLNKQIDELLFYDYLIKFNNKYFKCTKKAVDYLN